MRTYRPAPAASPQVRLLSVPSMGYLVSDTVHGRETEVRGLLPRGMASSCCCCCCCCCSHSCPCYCLLLLLLQPGTGKVLNPGVPCQGRGEVVYRSLANMSGAALLLGRRGGASSPT